MGILVTGGAGYIGSATVGLFVDRGEQVVVLDNLSRGHQAAVPSTVSFYQGDIGDRDLVQRIVREHHIEACIHFAAFAYLGESVANPEVYFSNNVVPAIASLYPLRSFGLDPFAFSPPSPPH